MNRPPYRPLVMATILLVSGAIMVADGGDFWRFAGGVQLIFVPALIAEYAAALARPTRISRLDALLMLDELDRADRRSAQKSQSETVKPSDSPFTDR